jgi:ribonuclease J
MLSIAIAIDHKTNELILPPTFYVKGLISQGSPKTIAECKALVEATIKELLKGKTNFAEIKQVIKTVAGDYLYSKTKKRPMIIPVVMSKVE